MMRVTNLATPTVRERQGREATTPSPRHISGSSMPPPPPPPPPPPLPSATAVVHPRLPPLSPTLRASALNPRYPRGKRAVAAPVPQHHSVVLNQERPTSQSRSSSPAMLDNEMSPCPKRSTPPPMILEEHHGDDSEGEEQAERSREERMHKSPTLSQPHGWHTKGLAPDSSSQSSLLPTGWSPITAWFFNKSSAGLPPGSARLPTPRWAGGSHEPLTPSVWLAQDGTSMTTSTGFTPTFAQAPYNQGSPDVAQSYKWQPPFSSSLHHPNHLQPWANTPHVSDTTASSDASSVPLHDAHQGALDRTSNGHADFVARPAGAEPVSSSLTTVTTMTSRTDLCTGTGSLNGGARPPLASPERASTFRGPESATFSGNSQQFSPYNGSFYPSAPTINSDPGITVTGSPHHGWPVPTYEPLRPLSHTQFNPHIRGNEVGPLPGQPLIGSPPMAARAPRSRRIDASTGSIGGDEGLGARSSYGWPSNDGVLAHSSSSPHHGYQLQHHHADAHQSPTRKSSNWPAWGQSSSCNNNVKTSDDEGQMSPYSPSQDGHSSGNDNSLERHLTLRDNAHHYVSDAAKWAAVQARDPQASAAFFYCVLSTKIFCRTTCPSRRPVRSGIFFVETASQATSLGYRACRRCKPDVQGGDPHEERQTLLIGQVQERLLASIHRGSNGKASKGKGLKYIAEELGVSHWHLHRCFKKRVGATPEAWAKAQAKRLKGQMQANGHGHLQLGQRRSARLGGGGVEGFIEGEQSMLMDGSPVTPSSADRSSSSIAMMHSTYHHEHHHHHHQEEGDDKLLALSPRHSIGANSSAAIGGGDGDPGGPDFIGYPQRFGATGTVMTY
ncbi:hypothetical protein BDZ90DRAFT_132048 [Jaminaea rosea]|uniref:Ada DNA repair metal-binding domain-containing protein n=1 Tax=Jaminaea rosea TaxID=1569628 RepID=A0A316UV04_9BASI|nr:hypothetical protein BDZ90DRAFT_132048 [Jaminaea rosea]PWN28834.1 hypothetical protein BDZ90DRAFT_132048 [Jaminaea rosea]